MTESSPPSWGVYLTDRGNDNWRLCAHRRGEKDRYRYLSGTRAQAQGEAMAWRLELEQNGAAGGLPSQSLGAYLKSYLSRQTHLSLRTRDWYEDLLLGRMIDPPDDLIDAPHQAFTSGVDPDFRIGR